MVPFDVNKVLDWIRATGATVSNFGKLDVLVNNAITITRYIVEETTPDIWDAQMGVDAKGTFLGTKWRHFHVHPSH